MELLHRRRLRHHRRSTRRPTPLTRPTGPTTIRCNNSPTGLTSTYASNTTTYSQRNYCDLTGVRVHPDSGDWSRIIAKPGVESGQSWLSHVPPPISEKMAPSSWTKWCDGAWQTPGIGGAESNIIPTDGNGPGCTPPVTPGVKYRITNGDGSVLVQSGAEVAAAAASTGAAGEEWEFTSTGDGFFTITNASSGKAVSAYATTGGARAWGAGLSLLPVATSGDALINQQWSFQRIVTAPATSGASAPADEYRLVNRYSGLALSLSPMATKQAAMAPVRQWDASPTATADTRTAATQELVFQLAP